MVEVRTADVGDETACRAILEALPDHFTPHARDEALAALGRHPAWVAIDRDGAAIGVLLAERRSADAAEITVVAVHPDRQRLGASAALVTAALTSLAGHGLRVVEVKTLDASSGYEPYVATRAFWQAQGFVQIDCIDPLPGWDPGNPAAILVAALTATIPPPRAPG